MQLVRIDRVGQSAPLAEMLTFPQEPTILAVTSAASGCRWIIHGARRIQSRIKRNSLEQLVLFPLLQGVE